MKTIFFLVAAIFFLTANPDAFSTEPRSLTSQQEKLEDFECARKLQKALKENDKLTVARLINYPLVREKPLPPIKSADDFIQNWGDFLDESTISTIIDKKPEIVGWRGVMLGNGNIWFNGGRIKTINMRTAAFEKKYATARTKESKNLYSTAQGYKSIELECDTPDAHIRIQRHDDGLYYFSWKEVGSMTDKPLLALKGTVDIQGSAGNKLYKFNNNSYSYEIYDPKICKDTCNIQVTTTKEERLVSSKICK